MSDRCPGWGNLPPTPSEWKLAPPTRRALLSAPILLAGATKAQAQEGDGSLARVIRDGVLRVTIALAMAGFVTVEGEAMPRMRDGFHEGMARLLSARLGVRVEITPVRLSGDARRLLVADEVDLALALPITRELLRAVMFCTPHLSLDLVLVSRGARWGTRSRADLQARRVATLAALVPALTDRGASSALPELIPVPSPWLLAQLLLDGSADGAIMTNVMANALMRRFPEAGLRSQFALSSSSFAGAVSYGNHDLLRAMNRIIEEFQLDGSLRALFRQETGLVLIPPFPS